MLVCGISPKKKKCIIWQWSCCLLRSQLGPLPHPGLWCTSSQLDSDWFDVASRPGWLKLASIMLSRSGCFLRWTRNFRLYKTGARARILRRGSLLTSPGHVVLARIKNYWTFGSPFFLLTHTHPVTSHQVIHCTSGSINSGSRLLIMDSACHTRCISCHDYQALLTATEFISSGQSREIQIQRFWPIKIYLKRIKSAI